MISVLIPTYNYNVYPLVREIHKQFNKTGISFEIRVYDDASQQIFDNQKFIKELPGVVYKTNPKNIGRLATRYRLAQDAQYDWLLFLDADVFPTDRFFASKLIKHIENNKADVLFGGITVPDNPPSENKTLRWKYGKYRENKSLNERINNPYKSFLSGTFAIRKKIFINDSIDLLPLKKYGLDPFFSYKLKQNQRIIHHYNNPATHLGLETNRDFINKTHDAMNTYKFLIDNNFLPKNYIKVTEVAYKIQKICPMFVCSATFKLLKPLIVRNLLSKNPSIKFFNLYKLLYFSQLK